MVIITTEGSTKINTTLTTPCPHQRSCSLQAMSLQFLTASQPKSSRSHHQLDVEAFHPAKKDLKSKISCLDKTKKLWKHKVSHQTVACLVYRAAAAASGWVRPRTTQHLWLQAHLSSPRSKQPKAIIQSNTIKSYQDLSSIPESHQTVARLVYLAAAAASGWVRPRTTQHLWLQAPLSSPRSKQPKAIIQSNTIKSYQNLSSIPESHQTVARLVYLAAAAASGWVRPRTTQHLWLQAPLSSPRSKQPKAIIQSNTIKSYQDLSSIPESHQTVARLGYLAAAAASGWVRPRTTQHLWLQAPLSSPSLSNQKQSYSQIQSSHIKIYQAYRNLIRQWPVLAILRQLRLLDGLDPEQHSTSDSKPPCHHQV